MASCNDGSLVGETSIRGDKPATATVIVRQPTRYFALEGEALRKLMRADLEIAGAIDSGNRRNLEVKLAQMNQSALAIN